MKLLFKLAGVCLASIMAISALITLILLPAVLKLVITMPKQQELAMNKGARHETSL